MNDKSQQYRRDYYEKNKEKIIKASEQWRLNNKEKVNAIRRSYNKKPERKIKMREYYLKNRDKICERTKLHHQKPEQKAKNKLNSPLKTRKRLLKQYGLTLAHYEKMLIKQKYTCAICKNPETAFDSRLKVLKKLAIDHCHKTLKVRGLLCGRCNRGLGYFKDSIEIIQSALKYIKG